MATYLVTGGAGFIGSHIVDRLLGEGHTVVVIDNFDPLYSPLFKESNILIHHQNPRFIIHRADITDERTLDALFEQHDFAALIHMAARPGVRHSFDTPELYQKANVEGTHSVFEASHRHGNTPIVYASSSTVYGDEETPFVEDRVFSRPALSPYGETKRETERIARQFADRGVPSIGLRFFSIYGERNRPDLATYLFTDALFHNTPLTLFGDGSYERDFTYVSDAVEAVMAALRMISRIRYDVINVGNDRPIAMNALIAQLENLTGARAQIHKKASHPGDVRINCADITKAHRVLGWKPHVALEEGLVRFVDWFRQERMH